MIAVKYSEHPIVKTPLKLHSAAEQNSGGRFMISLWRDIQCIRNSAHKTRGWGASEPNTIIHRIAVRLVFYRDSLSHGCSNWITSQVLWGASVHHLDFCHSAVNHSLVFIQNLPCPGEKPLPQKCVAVSCDCLADDLPGVRLFGLRRLLLYS